MSSPSISGNFHILPVATLDPSAMTSEREKIGPLPVWGWAVVCGLVVWVLYVFTLAPTIGEHGEVVPGGTVSVDSVTLRLGNCQRGVFQRAKRALR